MAKRPIANPNTTIATLVRTHARNVRSLARWSRARFESSTTVPSTAQDLTAALFHSLRRQRARNCNILDQFLRHAVPLLQILRTIVGDPNLAAFVLPYQRLQRQI